MGGKYLPTASNKAQVRRYRLATAAGSKTTPPRLDSTNPVRKFNTISRRNAQSTNRSVANNHVPCVVATSNPSCERKRG